MLSGLNSNDLEKMKSYSVHIVKQDTKKAPNPQLLLAQSMPFPTVIPSFLPLKWKVMWFITKQKIFSSVCLCSKRNQTPETAVGFTGRCVRVRINQIEEGLQVFFGKAVMSSPVGFPKQCIRKIKLVYVNICNTENNFEYYPDLMLHLAVVFNLRSDGASKKY